MKDRPRLYREYGFWVCRRVARRLMAVRVFTDEFVGYGATPAIAYSRWMFAQGATWRPQWSEADRRRGLRALSLILRRWMRV